MRRRVGTSLTLSGVVNGAMMLLHRVIAGLDPAIHRGCRLMDARVFTLSLNAPHEKFQKKRIKMHNSCG